MVNEIYTYQQNYDSEADVGKLGTEKVRQLHWQPFEKQIDF